MNLFPQAAFLSREELLKLLVRPYDARLPENAFLLSMLIILACLLSNLLKLVHNNFK
jgi:hypothetical protein